MARRVFIGAAIFAALGSAADLPTQIHVAFSGSTIQTNDGMIISWVTQSETAESVVNWGTSPSALSNQATGTQLIYLPLANGGTVNHHVQIAGLKPKSLYFYQCGDTAAGFSSTHNFTTSAAVGGEFPVEILAWADMGLINSGASWIDIMRVYPTAAFTWAPGDLSYADDADLLPVPRPTQFNYENKFNEFMTNASAFAANKAWMVAPGNHEAECHSARCIADKTLKESLGNFSAYNTRFRMPFEASGSTTSMWYSFRYGSIHFCNIDTETDFAGAPLDEVASKNGGFGDQLAWVEADLARAAADRAAGVVSWILVGGHRPMYTRDESSAEGVPNGDCAAFQASFEPLFHKYGVDLYFSGHKHCYESIWPTFNSTNIARSFDAPPYTTYVISGAAGNVESHSDYSKDPTPPWSRASNTADYGISTISFSNASSLTFTFRRATDGMALDTWTLSH